MRICLASPGAEHPAAAAVDRLAALLGEAHEVTVLAPPEELRVGAPAYGYCGLEHRRSAAVMEAIRAAYGERGPDYLEVGDHSPLGFVPLQARRGGDPLLARTLIGVRAAPSAELRALHDLTLYQGEAWRATALERWQLRHADRLIWAGGDTLDIYRRYYADLELPPARRIALPPPPVASRPQPRPAAGGPLRILYLGDLRRGYGVFDLLDACLSLASDEWELTLAGADTATATMGMSARTALETVADGDPRVQIREAAAGAELGDLLAAADLVALPHRIESWGEEGRLALRAGVPLLASPVGGHLDLVEEGVSGWLADAVGPAALARALEPLLGDRGAVERLRAAGGVAARAERLADPAPVLAGYEELAAEARPRSATPARPSAEPLVSGVIPYYGASRFVADAVGSLLAQTHRNLEVLVINDGSFAAADAILDELARDPRVTVVTQANSGESEARNLGATLARGEYVVMLDADNQIEPPFVERALRAFRAEPGLAYVSCWLRMVDEDGEEIPSGHGYAALGNDVVEGDEENWDGDSLAMLPRRLFTELGFGYGLGGSIHSDWELYRWLRQEGRFGTVLPERLARYRVVSDSLMRTHGSESQAWGWNESRARNRARMMEWMAGGG